MNVRLGPTQRLLVWFPVLSAAALTGAIASCSNPAHRASVEPAVSSTATARQTAASDLDEAAVRLVSDMPAAQRAQPNRELSSEWVAATDTQEDAQWSYILNSPLGVAALNQLAIEGFINPLCEKSFYLNEQTGGFQSLMKVECPSPRGASTAVGYDEIHVIFNRFESNIEDFEIRRFGQT